MLPAKNGFNVKQFNNRAMTLSASMGTDITMLRFSNGEWVHGPESIEVETNSKWAFAPSSLRIGYAAFDEDDKLVAEITSRYDEEPVSLEGRPAQKWVEQLVINVACVSGEDEGLQAVWKATSMGARRELTKLINMISSHASTGAEDIVPVCTLGSDSYQHKIKSRGRIFTPVVKVKEWVTMDAVSISTDALVHHTEEAEAEEEEVEVAAPRRRANKPVDPEPEDVEEEPAPRRRRQRA